MDQASTLQSAFNIIKRLPPSQIRKNVAGKSELISAVMNLIDDEDTRGELLSRVDQPLLVGTDPKNGYDYLKCEYNRDNKSHRSPWSNIYYPDTSDAYYPSPQKRDLEIKLNQIFKIYAGLYYDQAITSAYVWENEEEEGPSNKFAGCMLVKKIIENEKGIKEGAWDSIHIFDMQEDMDTKGNPLTKCKLVSTVIMSVTAEHKDTYGAMEFAGTVNKRAEGKKKGSIKDHDLVIKLVGELVEESQTDLLRLLDELYISKTKGIFNTTRLEEEYMTKKQKQDFYNELKEKASHA